MKEIYKPYLIKLEMKGLEGIDADRYPFSLPAVKDIGDIAFHPDVTFFVGENGSGKSTLLEAIAVAMGFNAEGGSFAVNFSTLESVSPLHNHLRLIRSPSRPKDGYFLRAESFFNVATYLDALPALKSFDHKRIHNYSHGEAFIKLIINKFQGNGIYLLDEPEAALSPGRQMAALSAIDQLVKNGSQLIIATHSPLLLSYPNARIYQFDETGVATVDYEETECFRLMRDFLNNYDRRLQQLLG